MAQMTENYGLYLEDDGAATFKEWREKMNGPVGSNMVKIDAALGEKQDKLTDGDGTTVEGNAVNIDTPVRGVLSQEEFDALPEAERNKGLYFVDDGEGEGSSSVSMEQVNTAIGEAVGDIAALLDQLNGEVV